MRLWQLDRNLQIRIFGETLNSILFWMYSPFMLIYFSEQFGTAVAGQLMIIPPFLGVFATLLGGYLADRFGRKSIMLLSLGLQGVTLIIFALGFSPWLDFLAYLSLNALSLLYRPASTAMIADLVEPKERKQIFALFYAASNLGITIGPLFGAFFFYNFRQQLIFTSALVTITLFFIMLFALRETLPTQALELAKKTSAFAQLKNYWLIFVDKVLFLYIFAGAIISAVFMQFSSYLAIYTANYVKAYTLFTIESFQIKIGDFFLNFPDLVLNVDGKQLFGWLLAENGLFVVLFSMLVAKLTQHWSDKKGLIISSLLFGFSLWLMSYTTSPYLLLLLMATFNIGELIRTPIVQNFIIKIAPEAKRAQYVAASSLQFSIGRLFSPISVIFAAKFSPFIIFTAILLISFIGVALYLLMFKEIEKNLTYKSRNIYLNNE